MKETDIFTLLGRIAIENDQANRALDETAEKAEGTGQKTENAFDGIGRAALGVGKFIVTAGAAIGGAWVAAIESTREYRAQMGLLDAAFQASGHNSTEAKNTYSELNAVLGDTEQAVEAAQHIALIADNEKEMNDLVAIGTGIFSTYGQSLPLEGLFEAVNHTASLGEVQGSLADALEWSNITVEDFNEQLAACSTEEERQDLIMKTLKDTYGKAAEQYKTTNKDVMEARKAQERLTDAFAEFGRIGEPILTAVKNGVASMVEKAVPKLESFIQKIKDAKKWMKDNKNTVDAWKAAIIATTVSVGAFVLVLKWGSIMAAATKAVKATRAAILLFNAALRANPIGLVISLLAGLVAGFVYLWKENDKFRAFWINLWEKIKDSSGKAINWVKGKFNDFKSAFNTVKTVFGNIQKTIADKIGAARDAVKKAIDKIKGFFNFKWSLPKLKMPTFSMKGKFSLNPPSVPKLGIKWNAEGAVLSRPTIFGRVGNTLMGGGEAGMEAVAPIDVLTGYIRQAVREENNTETLGRIIIEQNQILIDFLRRAMPHDVLLNGNALVGELIPAVDSGLADRYAHTMRGNVR